MPEPYNTPSAASRSVGAAPEGALSEAGGGCAFLRGPGGRAQGRAEGAVRCQSTDTLSYARALSRRFQTTAFACLSRKLVRVLIMHVRGIPQSKQRRNGYTRWTQGPEEVATSVQRLMAVVKAQPVPRLGAGVVVGDMFGADGAGADGRGRGGGHAGGDEVRVAFCALLRCVLACFEAIKDGEVMTMGERFELKAGFCPFRRMPRRRRRQPTRSRAALSGRRRCVSPLARPRKWPRVYSVSAI